MKQTARRIRRRASKPDGNFFKKSANEETFFGEAAMPSFFQPAAQNAVQRKCKECEEEDKKKDAAMTMPADKEKKKMEDVMDKKKKDEEGKKVMKKENASTAKPEVSYTSVVPSGGGTALPQQAQQYFGSRLGYDFSSVKIHEGSEAASMAKGLHAKAYTIGRDIVFNNGEYSTSTHEGKKLLAHELVHVMQQEGSQGKMLSRQTTEGEEEVQLIFTQGTGPTLTSNTTHKGCQGVSVEGHTDANYSNSFGYSGSGTNATDCEGCAAAQCVSISGTIVSTFNANPSVTLPTVPGGLTECEHNAVQNFIDTTLAAHEQQHVDAFNTYDGTVNTPYTYRGCASGEEAYVTGIHNGIEQARKAASDAASAALDPFNPPIPCDCPEPEASEPDTSE